MFTPPCGPVSVAVPSPGEAHSRLTAAVCSLGPQRWRWEPVSQAQAGRVQGQQSPGPAEGLETEGSSSGSQRASRRRLSPRTEN